MPLMVADLQRALKKTLSESKRPELVADDIAGAYREYAIKGLAGGALPIFTGVEKKVYAKTILEAIEDPLLGNPLTIAAALANGLVAFWLLPAIVVSMATKCSS